MISSYKTKHICSYHLFPVQLSLLHLNGLKSLLPPFVVVFNEDNGLRLQTSWVQLFYRMFGQWMKGHKDIWLVLFRGAVNYRTNSSKTKSKNSLWNKLDSLWSLILYFLSREHKCHYSGFARILSFILYDLETITRHFML